MVAQGDIIIIDLNPTSGMEKGSKRPCLVLSHESFNQRTHFAWLLPITCREEKYPTDVACHTQEDQVNGVIDCAQIRTVDLRERPFEIVDRLGKKSYQQVQEILDHLLARQA